MTMVQLYKDGEAKRVPAIDANGWLKQGWTTEPQKEEPKAVPEPAQPAVNLGETLDIEVDKALPKGTSQSKHKADK